MTTDSHEAFSEAAANSLPASSRRHRVGGAVLTATAATLLPLVELLDAIRPQVADESVFRTRRRKLEAHIRQAYAELRADRPRHRALLRTFRLMGALVAEETRDISPDELRQAAKEVVLAMLKNAPGLLNAAHQARLLS